MPSSTFWGMQHLNANVIAAVRIGMTGLHQEEAEMCEICVLPLDKELEPHDELLMFNMRIKPERPEDIDWKHSYFGKAQMADVILNSYDSAKVSDLFVEWFDGMDLKYRKQLLPIGHDYMMTRQVLINWLGYKEYSRIFAENYRDLRVAANYVNDYHAVRGESVPYAKQDQRWLAKKHDVEVVDHGGSCASDCMNIARTYKRMLQTGFAAL